MMKRVELLLLLIFVSLLIDKLQGRCSVEEEEALLSFKQSLSDPYQLLSGWKTGGDCCTWKGVGCSKTTNQVIKLSFLWTCQFFDCYQYNQLKAFNATSLDIASLFRLRHLRYLQIIDIYFYNASIPPSIDSLISLRYLILSSSGLIGEISPHLGNLTNLRYLDLGENHLVASNLIWISQLSSLKYLDMSFANLTLAVNWLQEISKLPALLTLNLIFCNLPTLPNSLSYSNFSSTINKIDISSNQFLNATIPFWLSNMTNLYYLNLRDCQLHGTIPSNLLGALNLRSLYLSNNLIDGSIPQWIGRMRNLTKLNLESNQLSGPIPHSLGQMINLNYLDLSNNQLQDSLSEVIFGNLSRLFFLALSNNKLDFNKTSLNWVPTFQLSFLYLGSCFIGPHFPPWLQTQYSLYSLDLSNNDIYDIPSWFGNISSHMHNLNMSYNAIGGELPVSFSIGDIDLRSNLLEGHLPQPMNTISFALFSNNKFSKGIEWYLNENMTNLEVLDLSENNFSGEIQDLICHMNSIVFLDLSHNNFSGEIPKCKENISSLIISYASLSNNNFKGLIPQWMVNLPSLESLHLSNNNFQGEIPFPTNNNNLIILDLGQNKLTGNIPPWIGDKLSSLTILCLRSNKFYGSIPSELSKLKELQILDLANNFLSGTVPKSFKLFNSMAILNTRFVSPISLLKSNGIPFLGLLMIDIKGAEREFEEILPLVKIMDLSCNNLSGEVPSELTSLLGLISLNLSRNHFTGHIPINIGIMQSLESLDLSSNNFSGEIPSSIMKLSELSYLNLSYNQLSGRIPTATQLDTFNVSSYYGNPELCGKPLLTTCEGDEPKIHNKGSIYDDDDDDDNFSLFLGMDLGFAIGLWSVLGILLLKRTWAIAYFQLINNMINNVYVIVVVKVNQWFKS